MKTVVIFQGGGALGAFGAGAWQVLARDEDVLDGPLIAVAGASIGAINAAAVAYNVTADGGALAIEALWRDHLTTPPFPFFGMLPVPVMGSHASAEHWNGLITGVLLGNPSLYRARWPAWQPVMGLQRLQQPLHDRSSMWRLLEEHFPAYRSAASEAPLLAVAATDVNAGELRLFDSDTAPVTAQHLAASSAIPLLFDPVEIDRRLYWDGEMIRDSLVPKLLARLLEVGRIARGEPLQLVTVESMPREFPTTPQSGVEILYRVLTLLQGGKLEAPEVDGIHLARIRRVVREPLAEDGVSGHFDYSPTRMEQLMEQGRAAARRSVAGSGARRQEAIAH
jgi:NTE family protein